MSLILNQGQATEYTFPRGFSMEAPPFMNRFSEVGRVWREGTVITSDQKLGSRPIRIWGVMYESTQSAFRTALENLRSACNMQGAELYADEHWPDKFIIVDLQNFDSPLLPPLMSADVEVLFRVVDPYWYSQTLSSPTYNIPSSQVTLNVSSAGLADVYPVITYYPGGVQMRFRLQNDSDGGRRFTYQGALGSGDELEVDCVEGTIKLNGTTHVQHLSDPSAWIKLVSGSNILRSFVTGDVGASSIKFVFRARWI